MSGPGPEPPRPPAFGPNGAESPADGTATVEEAAVDDDLYALLEVPPGASDEEIQRAFNRLAQDYLSSSSADPGRTERLKSLHRAYRILSDPKRRSVYDSARRERSSSPWEVDEGEGGNAAAAAAGAAAATATTTGPAKHGHTWNPVDRLTRNLPRPWRIAIDWAVTIIGAVLIVLALKQWVVNPYRIPSSSMEPTLHCARPGPDCEAHFSDRVLACRICLTFGSPARKDIIVFNTPPRTEEACNAGGTFVKRLIGLPGDTVHEDGQGFIWINGKKLDESYIQPERRKADSAHFNKTWKVPKGQYFFMGDNRAQSCDSRAWGSVPRGNLIGTVFFIYWPPNRIGFE